LPDVGRTRPRSIFIAVVLPAPFGPSSPMTWPAGTSDDKLSTAALVPYRWVKASTAITVLVPALSCVVVMDSSSGARLAETSHVWSWPIVRSGG